MTKEQEHNLNYFFETTFNSILLWEERALQNAGLTSLSIKELHIIEACKFQEKLGLNTMSGIASKIGITQSALTTAVNTLVRKKYITRSGNPNDRRIVYLHLTEIGEAANDKHALFHTNMVKSVGETLTEDSLLTLTDSLQRLSTFFSNYTHKI